MTDFFNLDDLHTPHLPVVLVLGPAVQVGYAAKSLALSAYTPLTVQDIPGVDADGQAAVMVGARRLVELCDEVLVVAGVDGVAGGVLRFAELLGRPVRYAASVAVPA